MFGVCRVGDKNILGGKIIFGAATVLVNGRPAGLAFTSPLTKKPGATILTGNPKVLCEGKPLARITSATKSGPMITGSITVRTL
jgi:uncharacterized Zn-binding protein involved in type VI secretion